MILSRRTSQGLIKIQSKGRTISIKVRYADFKTFSKSTSLNEYIDDADTIFGIRRNLLDGLLLEMDDFSIRLLGISISGFKEVIGNQKNSFQLELPFEKKT